MKKQKNKFAYLLVGIFIGILIAFSIAWWQGNDIGEWSFVKKVKSYFSNIFSKHDDQEITTINDNIDKTHKIKAGNKLTDPGLKNDSAFYDTTNIDFYDPAALDEFLARYNGQLPDSLVLDSIIKSQNNIDINLYNTSGNQPVKSDKIIFAKSYNIPGIDFFNEENNSTGIDSLLTDNKSKSQNKNKNTLRVEFWKSPINYKGYKISVNKLIIFGIDQFDMISFKMMNNVLFMKYMSDYYQIDKTIDFKPLVLLNNSQLISQLNTK
jgi:hypothetical protein